MSTKAAAVVIMRRRFGELFYVFATTIFLLASFVSDGEELI